MLLTSDQIAQFHRDGFVIIRGMYGGAELKALQDAADKVMWQGVLEIGEHHLYKPKLDGKKVYFRSENMWGRDPVFRAATVKPDLLACIGQCIGHSFLPINDSFVCKVPYGDVPIEWHQDPPYGFFNPPHYETFDIPNFDTDLYLDHSTIENGCVWGIPGKHLVGHVDLSKYSQEELFKKFGAVPLEMAPGDVLFHALSAPHGSIGNKTSSVRRIFYVHYMNEEVLNASYPQWVPNMRGFKPEGKALAKQMIEERKKLGWGGLEGAPVKINANGDFEFTGQPTTPLRYWGKLIGAIPQDRKERLRRLEQV